MDKLKKQVTFQTTGFLIVCWLLLFLPSWTINFWEAWVYWGVISFSIIIIDIYFVKKDPKLIERRMRLGTVGEKKRSQKILQSILSLFYVFLFVFPGFDHRYHWSDVPASLIIIADALVLLSYLIIFRVFMENSFTSSIIEVDTDQRVIMTGPYRVVRHPTYSGGILLFIATAFALGSFWDLFFVIPLILGVIIRLLDEEKFLSGNLEGYKEYCEKTTFRLIPGLW